MDFYTTKFKVIKEIICYYSQEISYLDDENHDDIEYFMNQMECEIELVKESQTYEELYNVIWDSNFKCELSQSIIREIENGYKEKEQDCFER